MARRRLSFVSLLWILLAAGVWGFAEEDLCIDKSCNPATGNLLIGRKHKISVTSTCGLEKPQRYCIVSHLEDKQKCFDCNSKEAWSPTNNESHWIQNVVTEPYADRTQNWWQSVNGISNVTIQLDLDAEFHFTHLIMTFRSFRPAAMSIERSTDFGKTWSVYRYFAYDCHNTFPGIPEGQPRKHGDVICSRKYSEMSPSTGGEFVYKVISPHIPTDDPYGDEIANLLKITNLRINLLKIHTLGDDLLDYRPEIDQKYFYAIYEIVVRGSCSCYGHAHRCIAPDNNENYSADMVQSVCDCQHHTTGKNCQKCEPFFNDRPWQAADVNDPHECKRCNCNQHSNACYFSDAEYIKSGNKSGGICSECEHNTTGKNCEQCKTHFYRDPQRALTDPYVCRPCQCDKRGSLNDGICQGVEDEEKKLSAGKCYCKDNVDGVNCDRCKNGYWDLREDDDFGCKKCTCHLDGTFNNEGCNKHDGSCTCKRLVTGANCDQCLPFHYGLSTEPDGCKACICDVGAALDNECDLIIGQCKCKEKFAGRRCNTTESGYFCAAIDFHTYEAESSENTIGNAVVEVRESVHGRLPTWSGEGFVKIREGSTITFPIRDLVRSGPYNIVIRYEMPDDNVGWENLNVTIVRSEDPSPDGPCANNVESEDFQIARLYSNYKHVELSSPVCLEERVSYQIRLYFGTKRVGYSDINAFALIDSIVLAPPTSDLEIFRGSPEADYKKQLYDRFQCREMTLGLTQPAYMAASCNQTMCAVAGAIFGRAMPCDCDPTGSVSGICSPLGGQCECKPNVIGRKCDRCAVGTYGFGPGGCTRCECDNYGALNNQCDKQSGKCVCKERGITGRQCDKCQPGFFNFPHCQTCNCNGHATECDQKTGICIGCRNRTAGSYCESCEKGYYGDPRLGVNLPCAACPCPGGPQSGRQFADTCYLQPSADGGSQSVVCNCHSGYVGEQCTKCDVNYWGDPREVGGSCEKCDCNGNIDRSVEGSCDALTGHCVKCLHNTDGIQCENCREGFYGDAKLRNCRQCVCNHLGTNSSLGVCDKISGQCPCFPNVVGSQCDECAPNHFNLASGKGCEVCACDPQGVLPNADGKPDLKCNEIDGQCRCKAGRGGRTCSECQDLHWGDPVHGECKRCECNQYGSASQQCHRDNGTCICNPGSGGPLCDQCSRGYTGNWPNCQPCGECFNNWDKILQQLRSEVEDLIKRADDIEDTGISSEYDEAFGKMDAQIAQIRADLETINITKEDVDSLRKEIEFLQNDISEAKQHLEAKNERVANLAASADLAAQQVNNLRVKADNLTHLAENLKNEATSIQRSDVNGAYTLIKESADKSQENQKVFTKSIEKITAAESNRLKAEQLLRDNQKDFDVQYEQNQQALSEMEEKIKQMEELLPSLNKQVCGGESAQCDSMCGGPSTECRHCGGESCAGSVSKAEQALAFAKEAEEKVKAKQSEAEDLLTKIRNTMPEVAEAEKSTKEAYAKVEAAAKLANTTKNELDKQIKEIRAFLDEEKASPESIKQIGDEIEGITIPFTEAQITELAEQIRTKVAEAKDTDQILAETRGNKTAAAELQRKAEQASKRASEIHNTTMEIRNALSEAEKAQTEAKTTLDSAADENEDIKTSLGTTENEITELEDRAKDAQNRIALLHNKTDSLKAEYIKITSSSKSASISATSATDIAREVEKQHNELQKKYVEVEASLSERENGNDERKEKAEKLHQRTTELLAKIKAHNDDAESLKKTADSLDIELNGFKMSVSLLSQQIDKIAEDIEKRVNHHATCDA